MNLADRFDLACRHKGISQREIARILGVSQPSVSTWKTGRKTVTNGTNRIAEILEVSPSWLEHGTAPAPVWLTQPDPMPPTPDQISVLTQNVKTLMNMMADMQKTIQELKNSSKPKGSVRPFRPSARPHLKNQLGQPGSDRLTKPTPTPEA